MNIITSHSSLMFEIKLGGLIDAIKKGQSVVLEISPKYYSTWDYGKQ